MPCQGQPLCRCFLLCSFAAMINLPPFPPPSSPFPPSLRPSVPPSLSVPPPSPNLLAAQACARAHARAKPPTRRQEELAGEAEVDHDALVPLGRALRARARETAHGRTRAASKRSQCQFKSLADRHARAHTRKQGRGARGMPVVVVAERRAGAGWGGGGAVEGRGRGMVWVCGWGVRSAGVRNRLGRGS